MQPPILTGERSESISPVISRLTRFPRWLSWLIGAALALAAFWYALGQHGMLDQLVEVFRSRPVSTTIAWTVLLGGGVVVNLVCTTGIFLLLTRPFAAVTTQEMFSLITSGTIINYIPLRPGMFARAAYHHTVNSIRIADIVKILINGSLINVTVAATLTGCAVVFWFTGIPVLWGFVPVLFMLVLASRVQTLRLASMAGVVKLVDVAGWMLRYIAAFHILGITLPADSALCLACAGTLANSIPFIGNGLGVREWAMAFLAPIFAQFPSQWGVTAELVNRAVELAIIVPLGAWGFAVLARRVARWKSTIGVRPRT